jgi:hypothetical protein
VTAPRPELRDRVLGAAKREPSPTRAEALRGVGLALAVGFGATLALFLWLGGYDAGGRPSAFVGVSITGWAFIAALSSWGACSRGRSMLGRPASWLWTIAAAGGPLLVAWIVVGAMGWPSTAEARCPSEIDVPCLAFTVLMSVGPFAAFLFLRRKSDPVHPRATGAALGAAAGTWGALFMNVHCACATPGHQVVAHAIPVVVLAVVGFLIGNAVLSVKPPPLDGAMDER